MAETEVSELKTMLEVLSEDSGSVVYPPIVDLKEVVKVYESPAGRYVALKGIDLQVATGEFVAVVGKSGSGKSTLMNMITGIDRPTFGEVYVNKVGIHKLSEGKIAVWRGKTVGIVFQFFQLLPTLTVIENVMLPMDFCHMYSLRDRQEKAMFLLRQVNLEDQAYKLPSTLSGGQQQRVAIARALANNPPIIIADEPTGNLDSKTADSIFVLFEDLIEIGKTIIMVTHDQGMASKVSRTIYLLDGRIVEREEYNIDQDNELNDQEQTETPGHDEPGELAYLDEELAEFRQHIAEILEDPSDAAVRLRVEIIEKIPKEEDKEKLFYEILIDEVNYQAKTAKEMGKSKYAQLLWKALAEATEE